jgi:hypothetical protein
MLEHKENENFEKSSPRKGVDKQLELGALAAASG